MSDCVTAPDLVALIGPRHVLGPFTEQTELEAGNHATRPPSCRTETELRPLATARPRRFDWSAWGTQQFLGRGAKSPQPPGRGKRPGGFDPEELFGAAWWLTPQQKVAARQTSLRVGVPVVTTRKRSILLHGDILSLDFRGHRVVRARCHEGGPRGVCGEGRRSLSAYYIAWEGPKPHTDFPDVLHAAGGH